VQSWKKARLMPISTGRSYIRGPRFALRSTDPAKVKACIKCIYGNGEHASWCPKHPDFPHTLALSSAVDDAQEPDGVRALKHGVSKVDDVLKQLPIGVNGSLRYKIADAGKFKSRHPVEINDCSIRALALVLMVDYDAAFNLLQLSGRQCNSGFDLGKVLDRHTAFVWQDRSGPLAEFALNHRGRAIVRLPDVYGGGHVCAVIDDVVFDDLVPFPTWEIDGVWSLTESAEGAD
jgi:hypothetical protein